jgi:integrase
VGGRLSDDRIICIVGEIGEAAGIPVWTHPVTGSVKFASAHDLRRSFGFRWAKRVMPAVLQKLMRHASINTTMDYYATSSAEAIADQVWGAWQSDPSGDSRKKRLRKTAK